MNRKIIIEITRQKELMNINEQAGLARDITSGLVDKLGSNLLTSLLKSTLDLDDTDSDNEDLNISNINGNIKHNFSGKAARNINYIIDEMKAQGIDPIAQIGILSVLSKESGFTAEKEMGYGNTSNSRIRNIFGKRTAKYSEPELSQLKKNDSAFFDAMYGKDSGMKLGNTQVGDGWKYVGRGFNGITGRANYKKIGNLINMDLEGNPTLLEDPKVSAKAAIAFQTQGKKIPNFKSVEDATKYFANLNAGGQSLRAQKNALAQMGKFEIIA